MELQKKILRPNVSGKQTMRAKRKEKRQPESEVKSEQFHCIDSSLSASCGIWWMWKIVREVDARYFCVGTLDDVLAILLTAASICCRRLC